MQGALAGSGECSKMVILCNLYLDQQGYRYKNIRSGSDIISIALAFAEAPEAI